MINLILFTICIILITIGIIFGIKYKFFGNLNAYLGVLSTMLIFGTVGLFVEITTPPKPIKPKVEIMYQDSTINEEACWDYITKMRIKHPKVVLSQAIEESRFNSSVFRKYNNLFGMKNPNVRIATVSSKRIGMYKYYENWQQCITDYALWQIQQGECWLTDEAYIEYLGKRYAENPHYKRNLRKIYKSLNYD